jgi:hypothetical protein
VTSGSILGTGTADPTDGAIVALQFSVPQEVADLVWRVRHALGYLRQFAQEIIAWMPIQRRGNPLEAGIPLSATLSNIKHFYNFLGHLFYELNVQAVENLILNPHGQRLDEAIQLVKRNVLRLGKHYGWVGNESSDKWMENIQPIPWSHVRELERSIEGLELIVKFWELFAGSPKKERLRRGAPLRYPKALRMGIKLYRTKPKPKDQSIFNRCKEKYGELEPLPTNVTAFMRTVRAHSKKGSLR